MKPLVDRNDDEVLVEYVCARAPARHARVRGAGAVRVRRPLAQRVLLLAAQLLEEKAVEEVETVLRSVRA